MRKAVKAMVGMPILPTIATSVAADLQSIIKGTVSLKQSIQRSS